MSAIATFKIGEDTLNIPYIYDQQDTREIVQDMQETAGGVLRKTVLKVRRAWRLETRPLTYSEAITNLVSVLDDNLYKAGDFWIDDLGASENTVKAYMEVERIVRVTFRLSNGTFIDNGRQLTLLVTEKGD